MDHTIINTIVSCMATNEEMSSIQRIQTEHRIKLVESWGIKAGSKVLEIGCGQGDTTAVLAYFVGENGVVQGIDIAPPTYGAPISLGESAEYLMKSPLGKQIKIDFEVDVLNAGNLGFPEQYFDYIVFSQCSWYLSSFDELFELMKKVKNWGKRLCFAEWDLRIQTLEQYPHLLSIMIQAQYEAFKKDSEANVRTLITYDDAREIMERAGWNILREEIVVSPEMHDGKWEVQMVLADIEGELNRTIDMPQKMKELIRSEIKLLRSAVNGSEIKPLSVFTFIAE
ncbi:class I SAM-dependent methyltransferase [Robertmurraya massiliosenegalensis]|uniref:class I SAM-dependent methyltransferase n=1 Tax=Robertmurraya massiliosenegalensis TaxID=1287657 RepID=UPI0002F67EB1|nr:methyltransferase domain-containing protein [Robertmurraya massiliosenegalensis]